MSLQAQSHEPVRRGTVSKSVYVYLSLADAPVTGVAFNTAGIIMSYAGEKMARVAITPADLASITAAWASGGFKEVDATNMPGWYRVDVPNAALALAAEAVVVSVYKSAAFYGSVRIPLAARLVTDIQSGPTMADPQTVRVNN
jgi:hypothetical protein